MDVKDDVQAALEAAASETEESSDEVSESEEEQETKPEASDEEGKAKPESKGKGAQGRIRELVDKSKGLQEEIESRDTTVGERDTEIGKLVDLLELKENDSRIVQRINELHADPRFKDKIEELDAILRTGELPTKEEEATEESEAGVKKVDESKTLKILEDTRVALEERIADQEAEIILSKADILADKYVDDLPKDYNDDDKRLIRELLTDRINWEAVEENPGVLPEVFAEGFQAALDHYGTPKGFVPEPDETDEPEKTEVTIEKLQNADWGRMKEITTPDGKKKIVPAVTDDQFTNSLADAIRKGNQ